MSLLTIVNDALQLTQNPQGTIAFSSSDLLTQQFVGFVKEEGIELSRKADWSILKVNSTIIGDGSNTLWSIPADFDRMVSGDALWSNKYPTYPLSGPTSDTDFLAFKVSPVIQVRPFWRRMGNFFEIWPALVAGEIVTFQYRTANWILDKDGVTSKQVFANDLDTSRLPEWVVTLGVRWRFKSSKGLEYAEDFRSYENAKAVAIASDKGGAKILSWRGGRYPTSQFPGYITVTP